MKRIRLTSRRAARIILANSYESLMNKLKVEYPDLIKDAAIYKSGETGGFVLHHLQKDAKYLVPSTDEKFDGGKDNRNRIDQSKYIIAVINYSKLKTDRERQDFINEKLEKNLILNDRDLRNDKIRLDTEMKNSVLIPKNFHGHLHGSNKDKIPRARNKAELYQQYLNYRKSISLRKLIMECEKADGKIYDEIRAIERMADYVFYEDGKQVAEGAVRLSYDKLMKILKQKYMLR